MSSPDADEGQNVLVTLLSGHLMLTASRAHKDAICTENPEPFVPLGR
jgi:hypothetical protein